MPKTNPIPGNEIVLQVLEEIKATHLPLLTVWNKVDACAQPDKIREIAAKRPNTVAVSAEHGEGIQGLLEAIEAQLSKQLTKVHCLVPYSQASMFFGAV